MMAPVHPFFFYSVFLFYPVSRAHCYVIRRRFGGAPHAIYGPGHTHMYNARTARCDLHTIYTNGTWLYIRPNVHVHS